MDERLTKIIIAAGAGIALAYALKPKDDASSGAAPAPAPGGFGPSPSLSFDGGGGGGGDTGKTASYGRANVRSYQQRINWLRNLLAANKLNADKTGIPYIPLNAGRGDYTKVDAYSGDWGPKTQAAANALKVFVLKAAKAPTKGNLVRALAAAGNGSEPDYEARLGKALMSFDTSKADMNDIAAFTFALSN